jgi:HK97 family phage prohead protease
MEVMKELQDKKEKEIRRVSYRVSGEENSRKIEGYAFLYGTNSDRLPFIEVIERGALEGVLSKSDVKALLNHNINRGVLARSKYGNGSLTLEDTTTGLRYSFEAPNTALGDELLENIRRGEIDESSFAFTVAEEKWEKTDRKDKDGFVIWKRTISKFEELFDVSPVYDVAYSETSVYLRGKEEAEKELAAVEEREAKEKRKVAPEADKLSEERKAAVEAELRKYEQGTYSLIF